MTPVSDNSRTTSNDITRPFEACPSSFFPTHLIGRHKKATFAGGFFAALEPVGLQRLPHLQARWKAERWAGSTLYAFQI
jgi:hypothetical protein